MRRWGSRKWGRFHAFVVLAVLAASLPVAAFGQISGYEFLVSSFPDRANPAPLAQATISGDAYVFTSPDSDVDRVRFWIDNPSASGPADKTENNAPFDLGGGNVATANPFDTNQLADGAHTVTAVLDLISGGSETVTTAFVVANTGPPLPMVSVNALVTNDPSPQLTGTVNDAGVTVEVSVAGTTYPAVNQGNGSWLLAAGTISPTLSDGSYDVVATGTNAAGSATDSTTDELTIDTVAPTITADDLSTQDPSPPLGGSVDDDGASVAVIVEGTSYAAANQSDGTWLLPDDTVTPLAPNTYQVTAVATDGASNTAQATGTLTIETPAPHLQFDLAIVAEDVEQGSTLEIPLVLSTSDSVPSTATVASSASWATVAPDSGSTPLGLELTLDPTGLGPGLHVTTITASSGTHNDASLAVEMTVTTGAFDPVTAVGISGTAMTINGQPSNLGTPAEGLLLNSRMTNATFDDANPATVGDWAYPDTGVWDPERNVTEFIAQLPAYAAYGLNAFSINMQASNPTPIGAIGNNHPWLVTAFAADGSLDPAWTDRLHRVIAEADRLGMVVILGIFYFGQDDIFPDEAAVVAAYDNAIDWVLSQGYTNVIIEVANESSAVAHYQHAILQRARVHELITRGQNRSNGQLEFSVSFTRHHIPPNSVLNTADYLLLHSNRWTASEMLDQIDELRAKSQYIQNPRPIIINEHGVDISSLDAAVSAGVSWGFYDKGAGDYLTGFQALPVNWAINTPTKLDFFERVAFWTQSALPSADLSMQIGAPSSAPAGQPFSTIVTATNAGPDAARPSVSVAIDSQLVLDAWSGPGSFDGATWDPGPIASGTSVDLTLTTTSASPGPRVLTAEVTGSDATDPDSTPGDGAGDDWATTSVDVTSGPSLQFGAALVQLMAQAGATDGGALTVAASDAAAVSFSVSDDADWLIVAPGTGTTPATLTLTANSAGLPAGQHTATVTATASGYSSASATVTFDVEPPPSLQFSSAGVALSADLGATDTSSVTLDTSDTGSATYSITDDAVWLTVDPTNGVTPEAVNLTADGTGLAPGLHTATVTATNTGYADAVLTVTFDVVDPSGSSYAFLVSDASDRSNPSPLANATIAGNAFIFTSPDTNVDRVQFWIDDPATNGLADKTENSAPYDLGGGSVATANPYDTTQLTDGPHTLTAVLEFFTGDTETITTGFTVNNSGPSEPDLQFDVSTVTLGAPTGGTDTANATINASDGSTAGFTITNDAPWLSVAPTGGSTPQTLVLTADSSGLSPGQYTATVTATAAGYSAATLDVIFEVDPPPALQFSASALTLSADVDTTDDATVTLDTNDGGSATFAASSDAPWLTVDPTTGVTAAAITLTADATGLGAGQYTATVTAVNAGYADAVLAVTFDVFDPGGGTYDFLVSADPSRSNPVQLTGGTVAGNAFIFTSPDTDVDRVQFWIDDPSATGPPDKTENSAPYDLAGGSVATANPFDTTQLNDGSHTITAILELFSGGTETITTSFTVNNNGPTQPDLLFDTPAIAETLTEGESTSLTITASASDGSSPTVSLSEVASWIALSTDTGAAPLATTVTLDTAGLAPGQYVETITASAAGFTTAVLTVTVNVTAVCTSGCALVTLPFALDWSNDEGGTYPDAFGTGTGFVWIDEPTNGSGYLPSNLAVNTSGSGSLDITTTAGLNFLSVNSLDNALAVGLPPPDKPTIISATLANPPGGSGNQEQAGIWFGNDEDNYVKAVWISRPSGTAINLLVEDDGTTTQVTSSDLGLVSSVQLTLEIDPVAQTVNATYNVGSGQTSLASLAVPVEFFTPDQAGIDPAVGTNSFAGVLASHRNGPGPLTYSFDDFSVTETVSNPPGPGDVAFDTAVNGVAYSPTAMTWAPDGRLYVAELFGSIHALSFDWAGNLIADETVSTALAGKLLLGLTVDPSSTPGNITLWASHSVGSGGAGDPGVANSSTVSRLTGSGFNTVTDVITGLPRAIANHAVNEIHFGPDGRLYIALGGNTGAGAPNDAGTEFGTRPEQYLSAALLAADVNGAGFSGDCADPFLDDATGTAGTSLPASCDVELFATGLRNMYDFTFHSNGEIYATDNGLGVSGTVPASSSPDCQGIVQYDLPTDPLDPGITPDLLIRIESGSYYGHPNPARGECVFRDGTFQGVAPLPTYSPPLFELGERKSANGIVEFASQAFCGTMAGDLLIANYSQGDDITRVELSASGNTVTDSSILAGGFDEPLPLVVGPDGTIYVGEFRAHNVLIGRVTALVPEAGCFGSETPAPEPVTDAEAAAIGSAVYMVGGKNTAGHLSSLSIYNTASDTWSVGADRPGLALEDAAVVAAGGQVYAFGGATSGLSGASNAAHVYDPGSDSWTTLPSMASARSGAAAAVTGGLIYVIGGLDAGGISQATVEVFDTTTGTWGTGAALPEARDNASAAVLGGDIFVFGGRTRTASSATDLASATVLASGASAWSSVAPMATARRSMGIGTLNGRAQLVSGESNTGGAAVEAEIEEYDPGTNSWRTLADLEVPRHGLASVTVGGAVYLIGGAPTPGLDESDLLTVLTLP